MIIILRLKSERELDAIRGLRWLLKAARRRYGLRCIELRSENDAWLDMWRRPLTETNPDCCE
jgi:hypothetical protein